MLKMRDGLVKIYSEATGKDEETIQEAIDRDTWLSAKEAKEFGLIDKVIESSSDLPS